MMQSQANQFPARRCRPLRLCPPGVRRRLPLPRHRAVKSYLGPAPGSISVRRGFPVRRLARTPHLPNPERLHSWVFFRAPHLPRFPSPWLSGQQPLTTPRYASAQLKAEPLTHAGLACSRNPSAAERTSTSSATATGRTVSDSPVGRSDSQRGIPSRPRLREGLSRRRWSCCDRRGYAKGRRKHCNTPAHRGLHRHRRRRYTERCR
jgi:hypothetical protein